MFLGLALAATHFLVSWAMTFDEDASAEFAVTQAYFSTSQSVRKDAGKWVRGDKFLVEYKDGVVAEFTLSSRGMSCMGWLGGPPCRWATTVPFDSVPRIVQQRRSSLPVLNNSLGIAYQQLPAPLPVAYPVPMPFARSWEVWVGPMVNVTPPVVPGCGRNPCPMLD